MSDDEPGSGARVEATFALTTAREDELATAYVVHDCQRAFRELHRRLSPYLLAVARRRVHSRHHAEDLVQQAFINAHLARERFELGSSFRPWITRILLNLVYDHCRSVLRRPIADVDVSDLALPPTADTLERAHDVTRARVALASLRPRQRQVIEMHWLEERSFPEVAQSLGERVSTVKVRAHRAYRELREALESNAS
jgi:RNA polymerase sigma-70 factor (ECF subfamily)